VRIQNRLIALLGLLVVVFAVSLWLLRSTHERENQRMLAEIEKERSELLDRLLKLTGLSLQSFAADYSLWSEMVDFLASRDPKWAEVNLQASLANFNAHGAWVLRTDGTQIYGTVRDIYADYAKLPMAGNADFLAHLRAQRFSHFFLRTGSGLLEFRTAPIQPSHDTERTSEPRGWLLVARLWGPEHQTTLQGVLESDIELHPPGHVDAGTQGIVLHRPLLDWQGAAVAQLHVRHLAQMTGLLDRENATETALFLLFGVSMLFFAIIGVSRWIVQPLRQLERSLEAASPAPLAQLRFAHDEFGRLAQLVENSFAQRQTLEREVEVRRRTEEALRQSQAELRSAADLRSRLARDLHDGVIQSIYAAGLGLEGIRALLRHDPDTADRRLVAAQTSLNQTIREVRSFIQGLEPEESERPDFVQALRSLIQTLQALHPVQLRLHTDAATAPLSAREEVHALQMVRECVSNALRHGGASCIDIVFETMQGAPALQIRDDGRGFDPAVARVSGGSGLANLASRAAEIGATLTIDSSPGKGTGISIRFNQTRSVP